MPLPRLILASGSPYRAELLRRLHLPFEVVVPRVDESLRSGEPARQAVQRLAVAKAEQVASRVTDGLIIASDQLAELDDHILRKPETPERAVRQLKAMRGRLHHLWTALCLLDAGTGRRLDHLHVAKLWMRDDLTDVDLQAYVSADQPLNCAGSYKLESLGICLFSRIDCDDWTGIQGLPLMALVRMLSQFGISLPAALVEKTGFA